MFIKKFKRLALVVSATFAAGSALAQDSKALIDALIKKGILTNDEAAQIAADVTKSESAMDVSTGGSKFIKKIALQARFQTQFASLATSIDGAAANPASTNHFLLRRLYFGVKPDFGDGWSGNFNYDFANLSFDAAYIEWKQSDAFAIDAGLRKVPFGYEETTSSGNLRAIERSPVTRYFVESNNGRRLGAGSYHMGVYAGGTQATVFYNVAITNPERDEFSTGDSTANSTPGVNGVGSKANNNFAFWGNLGVADKFAGGNYRLGVEGGMLPDQGGKVVGAGDDLTVYGAFLDVNIAALSFQAEWLGAKNDHGVSATTDAKPSGFWLQPAYRIGDLEGLVRYTYVDSDHRGVDLADGIRSAPSGGAMNKMSEWFVGGNYYFHGNDTKLQAGYIHGESKDTVTGGAAKAKTDGVRGQVQLNF